VPPLKNTETTWGLPTRLLHWTMAALILFMLVVGFYMTEILQNRTAEEVAARFSLTQTHKSFGFVVFALALVRIGWRAANAVHPAPPAAAKPWENAAARAAHVALYVLTLWMPLSGWLMASASPLNDAGAYPVQIRNMVFGLFELPDPIAPGDRGLEAIFGAAHFYGGLALAALLAVHAGAALKHHFLHRDDVLRRITVGR
jgi:cytochrome b561